METLTIVRPDDWHVHVRDGELMQLAVPDTARQFGRAIIMPNLNPPVTSVTSAAEYRGRIASATPAGLDFEPLMTLYLTEDLPAEEIARAKASGFVHAVKWYPAGATTNSQKGVRSIDRCYPVLAAMEEHALPLLVHAETTDSAVDIFDREAVFLEATLAPLLGRFPGLRVVVEHLTSSQAVQFLRDAAPHVGGTITAHHLTLNRNDVLAGGIRPHLYCLPIVKRESHRQALLEAATSGEERFFLGTDSAPHPRRAKESACGCAGIYTAHAAMELYAEVFEQAGALDRLEAFASFHGPDFYGLPRNTQHMTLEKRSWEVPQSCSFGSETLVPFRGGESLHWRVVDNDPEDGSR